MPRLLLYLLLTLTGLTACAPVMIGLTAGQIASNVIKTAVKVKQIRQQRAQQEALARQQSPNDFLDVGDSLKKALARLGEPATRETRGDLTWYFFPNRNVVDDTGRLIAQDLHLSVDRQENIAEITLSEPRAAVSPQS